MVLWMFGLNCTNLKILAVNALAVVPAVDACLEALTVLLEAARLLAVAALIVTSSASHSALLLRGSHKGFQARWKTMVQTLICDEYLHNDAARHLHLLRSSLQHL
jgi:hypothetical protein